MRKIILFLSILYLCSAAIIYSKNSQNGENNGRFDSSVLSGRYYLKAYRGRAPQGCSSYLTVDFYNGGGGKMASNFVCSTKDSKEYYPGKLQKSNSGLASEYTFMTGTGFTSVSFTYYTYQGDLVASDPQGQYAWLLSRDFKSAGPLKMYVINWLRQNDKNGYPVVQVPDCGKYCREIYNL